MLNEVIAVILVLAAACWRYRSSLPFMALLLMTMLLMVPIVTMLANYGWWPGGPAGANASLQLLVLATIWLILLGIFRFYPQRKEQ